MLSRKHYKAIAEILQSEYTRYAGTGEDDGEGKNTVGCIAGKLSDYFTTDNPQFNRQKFLDACGTDGGACLYTGSYEPDLA